MRIQLSQRLYRTIVCVSALPLVMIRSVQFALLLTLWLALWLLPLSINSAAETPEQRWKRAIDRDDAAVIWQMLSTADVTLTNDKGKSALMTAARLGDQTLLQALIARGLSLKGRSFTGGTVLMYAALGNQLDMLKFLKQQVPGNEYLDAQSTNGWTAIMIAAAKGFDGAVKLLVDDGADPWLADAYQWSPLMRAIDNQHAGVVRYLLTLPNASVNQQNENGSTALHIAVLKGDIESAQLLLASGAKTEIKDKNSMAAVDIAVANGSVKLLESLQSHDR